MSLQHQYQDPKFQSQPDCLHEKFNHGHARLRNHQDYAVDVSPHHSNISYSPFNPPPVDTNVFQHHAAPSDYIIPQSSPERKLIAIPATGHKAGSPILRAWPPVLESSGLSKVEFLKFIDRLNRVTVSSPPIQVLGLAGNIVGIVPLATTQIVGGAVNASAMVTSAALRRGHTEMLLQQANREIFRPLGLNVKLAKMEAVAKLTEMPMFDASGKADKNVRFLPPLDDEGALKALGVHQRRLMALQPYISPLSTEALPEMDRPTNYMAKMHEAVSVKQAAKEEKDMMKKRSKKRKDKEEKALRKLLFLVVESNSSSYQSC